MFNFLRRKKSPDPVEFISQIITDIHSHLINEVDDGSKSIEDSIRMIARLNDLGYQNIITTPHIMSDLYPNEPETLRYKQAILRHEIQSAGLNLNFSCAAEYLLDEGFEDKMESGQLMTFGDKFLLVEMGFYNEFPALESIIFKLKLAGYQPVLAHVERYPYYFDNVSRLEEISDKGIYFQLNLFSLFGHYGDSVKKMAQYLLDKKYYHFIGTDLHNEFQLDTWQTSWKKMAKEARSLMDYSFENHLIN